MTCFYCGTTIDPNGKEKSTKSTKDHIYPKSLVSQLSGSQFKKLGREFHSLNLVDCCSKCNTYKGQLHPLDWLLIMPNSYNAARLAERMVKMGEDMEHVFDALKRRRK